MMFADLQRELERSNIEVDEKKVLKLKEYWDLLLMYNRIIHLFSRKSQGDELKRQFYDIILLNVFLPEYEELVDAGSGAGFAGIILGILNPERNYILVERSAKKGDFLQVVTLNLNLSNITVLKQDIEAFESESDVVVSKASCMRELLEKKLTNIVRVGGILVHFASSPLPPPYKNYPYNNPFRKDTSYLSVLERVV